MPYKVYRNYNEVMLFCWTNQANCVLDGECKMLCSSTFTRHNGLCNHLAGKCQSLRHRDARVNVPSEELSPSWKSSTLLGPSVLSSPCPDRLSFSTLYCDLYASFMGSAMSLWGRPAKRHSFLQRPSSHSGISFLQGTRGEVLLLEPLLFFLFNYPFHAHTMQPPWDLQDDV